MTDPKAPNETGETASADAPGTPSVAPPAPPAAPPVSGLPSADAPGNPYTSALGQKAPVLSIISLIAGIVGLLLFWLGILPIIGSIMGMFIPAAAIVLGFIGRKKEPTSKGMWLTGIILGFIGIAISLLFLVFWIVVAASAWE